MLHQVAHGFEPAFIKRNFAPGDFTNRFLVTFLDRRDEFGFQGVVFVQKFEYRFHVSFQAERLESIYDRT